MSETWDAARFAHPRFVGIADLVARFATSSDWPSIAFLNDVFATELALANVTLVETGKLEKRLGADGTIDPLSLYEVRIVETGEIATRPRNAHDLLNALAWIAFPRSKRELTKQLAEIQRGRARGRATLPPARTRDHDRLAMIDEGAVVRRGPRAWIFGHAIYEHAYRGEFDVRGSLIELAASEAPIDHDLAATIANAALLDRAFRRGPGIAIDDALLVR